MFNKSTISTCFTSLVGWRESSKAPVCFSNLSSELTTSNSGLFVNDIPGMNLELINEVLSIDEANVNTFLENQHDNAALQMINQFVIKQKQVLQTKALLEDFSIGTRFTNIRDLEIKRGRFVGFEIKPTQSNNVRVAIKQLGVQFDTIQTSPLKIYFYASSSLTFVKTFDLTNTKQSTIEWFTLTDFIADYISDNLGTGDCYFLGYYEDELEGQAVETELPCSTCGNSPFKHYSKFLTIRPIEVEAGATFVSREIFEVEEVGYTNRTHGLHLKIDAKCDISNVICDSKELFADLLRKRIAINLFWEAYNSHEIDRVTIITKDDSRLMAEKLEIDYENELETISLDFSKIDQVCLPCKRRSLSIIALR